MGDLPNSFLDAHERALRSRGRSQAIQIAEQTPYTPSTPLRRPTRPQPRQGDYARERQYRIEGARDRLLRGPDRLGAVGELAADLTGAPALVQHMRARMAGDRQSAVTEGLTGLAQASGFVGLPGRGMSGALAQEWRPAVSARTYRGMNQPFDPDRVAPRGPYGYGRDTSEWSAADPAVANEYAVGRSGSGANVESLRTEMARPLRVDAGGALYTDLPRQAIPDHGIQRRLARGEINTDTLAAAARRSGRYDGVVLENVRDPLNALEPYSSNAPTTVYATLYPRMSRPEFGAAHAPAEAAAVAESQQRIPRAIQPQTRASDGTILPAQPRETFGRPFSRTAGTSGDLREAAQPQPPLRGGTPEALQRAREQGFDVDTPLYHGTRSDFAAFDPSRSDEGASWLTPSTDLANEWTGPGGRTGQIMPTVARGDFANVDFRGQPYEMGRVGDALDAARQSGKDGVRFRRMADINGEQTADQVAIFDPRNIRSRFAAFDPARSGESDLLASVAAPVAAAALFGGRKRRK